MRARVYIDGFNLYYRGLKTTRYKWLNIRAFAQAMLASDDHIDLVRYFTTDVSPRAGDPEAPTRQEAYFRALRTLPGVKFHKGRFLAKTVVRPLSQEPSCFVEVNSTEEKGSDVNLATYLVRDAFLDEFDLALVVSQDTDLIEPLRVVKEEVGKIIGVVWLENSRPGNKHRQVTSFIRHARPSVLRDCQFPNPVIGKGGRKIWKPEAW